MKVDELRALSIDGLVDYLTALEDLPRPVSDEAQANFRQAFHALRDKYDAEHAAALGVSVAEYRAFSDAIVAGVPSSIQSSIHAQIMAMSPHDLHQFLQQFLREIQAKLDRRDE
jgi:hypothetical protein